MWAEQQPDASAGMDELLAVLGYKVKSSDMAEVAQKLEQLEMVMGTEDGISHLACDTMDRMEPAYRRGEGEKRKGLRSDDLDRLVGSFKLF